MADAALPYVLMAILLFWLWRERRMRSRLASRCRTLDRDLAVAEDKLSAGGRTRAHTRKEQEQRLVRERADAIAAENIRAGRTHK
jgi:hypothetical protein